MTELDEGLDIQSNLLRVIQLPKYLAYVDLALALKRRTALERWRGLLNVGLYPPG